jgi:hypothetical protein
MAERRLETLADLGDRFAVHVFCSPCGRSTALGSAHLVAVYGPSFTLDELRRRLTCSKCGKRSREIRIVYTAPSR